MLTTNPQPTLDRSQAIAGLARIRQEWEETLAEEGKPFATNPVAYLLHDVAEAIGLTHEEEITIIGSDTEP